MRDDIKSDYASQTRNFWLIQSTVTGGCLISYYLSRTSVFLWLPIISAPPLNLPSLSSSFAALLKNAQIANFSGFHFGFPLRAAGSSPTPSFLPAPLLGPRIPPDRGGTDTNLVVTCSFLCFAG